MENIGTYIFGNHSFRIKTIHPFFHRISKRYLADKKEAEFDIEIKPEDIAYEKSVSKEKTNDEAYEFTAIERKVITCLAPFGFVVFHGALIAIDGSKGYLFTAKSGTGKTTHINLYKKLFGNRCRAINGDKPLLKIEKDGVYGYGTPWCGKEFMNANARVRINGIAILNRCKENKIKQISIKDAYAVLMSQIHKDVTNPESMEKTMKFVDEIGKKTHTYALFCNMDIEAAKVSYKGMTKKLSFADCLLFDKTVSYVIKGTSMLPLLKENVDIVTIDAFKEKPKKYDVVLYRSRFYHAPFVLHRIIGVTKRGYILCGDNQTKKEYGVQYKDMYGILTSIDRRGKIKKTTSFGYQLYSRFRVDFFFLRRFLLKIEHLGCPKKRKKDER